MIMPKLNINEGFDKLYNNKCSEDLHAELDVNYDDNVHEDNLEEYADNLFKHIDESEQNVVCSSKCYEMYLNRLNRFKDDKQQLESDLRDIEELAYNQMSSEEVEDLKNAYQFYIDKLDEAIFIGDSRDKETIKRKLFKEPTVSQLTQDQVNKIISVAENSPKLTQKQQDELGDDDAYYSEKYAKEIAEWQMKNFGFTWKM